MSFGPWRPGLDPQAKLAHIRSLRRLAKRHCPSQINFRGELKRAEISSSEKKRDIHLQRAWDFMHKIPSRWRRGLISNYCLDYSSSGRGERDFN
jgi:hypothetical protein